MIFVVSNLGPFSVSVFFSGKNLPTKIRLRIFFATKTSRKGYSETSHKYSNRSIFSFKITVFRPNFRFPHRCPRGRNCKLYCSDRTCNEVCKPLKRGKVFVLQGPAAELALIEPPQHLPEAVGRPASGLIPNSPNCFTH